MNIRVRFAPSPTGMLHIGSARTALFNYLFAKKNQGEFLLRIEDTDKNRSTQVSINAIFNGLKWLNINYDQDVIYQSSRYSRHVELVNIMLKNGSAYYAYDTEEELKDEREKIEKQGKIYQYNGQKWRNGNYEIPKGIKPVIRLKVPTGNTILNDLVRGKIEFNNKDLDDLVLIRSDGTPTYMLAVVVDDIDMKITHIIRGDDHISNTPKQILIYNALGASLPQFAHIPLIHDIEGKKLSKRKGASAVEEYKDLGYLSESVFNYLLHLGGGYDKDIISLEEAIENFDINNLGKSPSRFDFDKLNFINLHYIKNKTDDEILNIINEKMINIFFRELNSIEIERIKILMIELKKSDTTVKIFNNIKPFVEDFDYLKNTEDIILLDSEMKDKIIKFKDFIKTIEFTNIKDIFQTFLKNNDYKMKDTAGLIRYALIGKIHSFPISLILESLNKEECLQRLQFYLSKHE